MLQPYNQFEERRKYPRVNISEPVVVYYNDNRINAEIHDLSSDGIQVRCDRKGFQMIHPSGRFIRKDNALVVNVRFHLKLEGKLTEINVRALMYYFVVLPNAGERDIAFGLRFISMDDNTTSSVNAFIEAAMTPDDVFAATIMTEPVTISELSKSALNSYDVQTTLLDLLKKHDVKLPKSVENDRYQCLVASIETLFEKIGEIENRIYRLEKENGDL